MNIRHTVIVTAALGAAIGLATAAGSAEAATIANWGTLAPNSDGDFSSSVNNLGGHRSVDFTHDYTFSVSHAVSFEANAMNNNLMPWNNIKGLQLKLYQDGPGGSDTLLGQSSTGLGSLFEVLGLTYASLSPAADYILRIAGTVERGKIGSYLGSFDVGSYQVSPVPLPGAAIMFGSGLLSLIAVGRQRRANRKSAVPQAA